MKQKIRNKLLTVLSCGFSLVALAGCASSPTVSSSGIQILPTEKFEAQTLAMSTIVLQTAYGENAQAAMREVNRALPEFEARLSLFDEDSDIASINAGAGSAVAVEEKTAAFIQKCLNLSAKSEGAFAVTIAPLTTAWGITTDTPRVVGQAEIDSLLPLVNDAAVTVSGNTVQLAEPGMGLDLGGIAKGEACTIAKDIYDEHGVTSALLSIGGNTYAHGTKPDGSAWRVGFRDPFEGGNAYIAAFDMVDTTIAVSDGSERFFTDDAGNSYIHIINPQTGYPAKSDIASVGVVHPDGAEADFYSTTLFVWGKARALEYMRAGGQAILLDYEGNLYISTALQENFTLNEGAEAQYSLHFI